MYIERLTDKNHPLYKAAKELYSISFPYREQRENISQEKILCDDEYCFGLVYDEAEFVGLALYWETESFIYVEHLCISPEMRNRNYGSKVLNLLCEKHKTVILEIDPPIDEISIRRKGFYERNGFEANPYNHVHPPYHTGVAGHDLVIMTYPKMITQIEYDNFDKYLKEHIMKDACGN